MNCAVEKLLKDIIPRLHDFESMTWKDVTGKENHFIAVEQISGEAQKRLAEIDVKEADLFSMRFSAKERAWGVRDKAIFRFLWWDPEHKIYPVEKKNT